jgi:hypothetical protein
MERFGVFYGSLVFMHKTIWYIFWAFGILSGHLVYFVAIWYTLWPFGILCGHLVHQEKSGNPALDGVGSFLAATDRYERVSAVERSATCSNVRNLFDATDSPTQQVNNFSQCGP